MLSLAAFATIPVQAVNLGKNPEIITVSDSTCLQWHLNDLFLFVRLLYVYVWKIVVK